MACQDGRLEPARAEVSITVADPVRGRVKLRFYDRVGIDDVVTHLIERELFRLSGGGDAGIDVNQNYKDFLIRENYLEVR